MIVLVALGLAAVDIITLTSLHSYLYGRVDDQLTSASRQMASFVDRADQRSFAVTPAAIGDPRQPGPLRGAHRPRRPHRWSPARRTPRSASDPAPALPADLPGPARSVDRRPGRDRDQAYRPSSAADRPSRSAGGHGPEYRLPGHLAARADPGGGHPPRPRSTPRSPRCGPSSWPCRWACWPPCWSS